MQQQQQEQEAFLQTAMASLWLQEMSESLGTMRMATACYGLASSCPDEAQLAMAVVAAMEMAMVVVKMAMAMAMAMILYTPLLLQCLWFCMPMEVRIAGASPTGPSSIASAPPWPSARLPCGSRSPIAWPPSIASRPPSKTPWPLSFGSDPKLDRIAISVLTIVIILNRHHYHILT
jgi:hypothetical protein